MTTLYGLANCDTCKKARNWLGRFGVKHDFVDYREQRIEPATLKAWAQQLGGWDKLVNQVLDDLAAAAAERASRR